MTFSPDLPALKSLRRRMTLVYLLAALALVALIGGGAYGLLSNYFFSATDSALRQKMSTEVIALGARDTGDATLDAQLAALPQRTTVSRDPDRRGSDERHEEPPRLRQEDSVNPDLLAVYVLPVDATGNVLGRGITQTQISVDANALQGALSSGSDWRTVRLSDGGLARLYTVRVEGAGTVAALQLGRSLSDQTQILNYLLMSLLGLAALAAVLVGTASWWLSGRSIAPAREAWAKQQAFVANASHELRAPLTLLRASAETARDELPAAAQSPRALLSDVLDETDHMNRLVDDLLLLSRLDAGKLPLLLEPVDLAVLAADTVRGMERLAAERGLTLKTHLPQEAALMQGDPTRLRQIILNALDNALRYTPRGGCVTVSVGAQGGQLQLAVADTGIGMAREDLARVFDRFYRADSARREGVTGNGLGLSITRALVEAHKGRIALDSAPGQGTRLTATFPRLPSPHA